MAPLPSPSSQPVGVPPVGAQVVEEGDLVTLRFGEALVQSAVSRADPERLVLPYTRAMMGFLLFAPSPARIAMIGLGGGALARACRRVLPDADFTAIELSAEVIALREVFGVPADGPRFRVLQGDGAAYVGGTQDPLDVLLVDGFSRDGQPEGLSSAAFYAACAARLAAGGVLVVNLTADGTGYGSYVRRIRDAFGGHLVVVETEDAHNKIVFAGKAAFAPEADRIRERARAFAWAGLGLEDLADRVIAAHRKHATRASRRA